MAAAYCAGIDKRPAMADRHRGRWDAVIAMARSGLNAPLTSSAGRLFDAVASLAGVRDEVFYEGQAAMELEQLADRHTVGAYRAGITGTAPFQVNGNDFAAAVIADLDRAAGAPEISMRFHRGLALSIADGCELVRETSSLNTVALSGGVFQNLLLSELAVDELQRRGFEVLTHHRIPANDGGISIGQAAIAAARDGRTQDAR
jgi:hydrogenase maturation protein HypF